MWFINIFGVIFACIYSLFSLFWWGKMLKCQKIWNGPENSVQSTHFFKYPLVVTIFFKSTYTRVPNFEPNSSSRQTIQLIRGVTYTRVYTVLVSWWHPLCRINKWMWPYKTVTMFDFSLQFEEKYDRVRVWAADLLSARHWCANPQNMMLPSENEFKFPFIRVKFPVKQFKFKRPYFHSNSHLQLMPYTKLQTRTVATIVWNCWVWLNLMADF